MKHRLKWAVLALCGLFCLSLSCTGKKHEAYRGSRIFWDAQNPSVVFPKGGYARLIELQDGRLLACAESNGIWVAFSNDKGSTWTGETVIAPNHSQWSNCVPDLIQLRDGTIIVAYNPRAKEPYSPDRPFSIRLRRSMDGGATWSEEITVYDGGYTWEDGCWEPSLLELPSGELQLYFADESPYTTNADQQISLCRSQDGGQSWSRPECVSYRSGFRDGMPVPVLLKDRSEIVVAIEDNGWEGIGDFIPTTVRTSLANNWKKKSYVAANSESRRQAVNYNYCPMAKGGAPYLRVLPNGETILSHQSRHGVGDNHKMYCYVGDSKARDFKAMTCPFRLEPNQQAMWNSLAVIDKGVVAAVAGIRGKVLLMRGYPKERFEARLATPTVDGYLTDGDGYSTENGRQVMMGNETGTYTYVDFAYDADSLYLFAQVFDSKTVIPDLLRCYIQADGAYSEAPTKASYRLDCPPMGNASMYRGDGQQWVGCCDSAFHIEAATATSHYCLEIAVAWNGLGLKSVPRRHLPLVNLEIVNSDGVTELTERIPDARPDAPWTWMPLHLQR